MSVDPKKLDEKLEFMKNTMLEKDQKIQSWIQELLTASKSEDDFKDAYALIKGYETYIVTYAKLNALKNKDKKKDLSALSKLASKNLNDLANLIKKNSKVFLDEDAPDVSRKEITKLIDNKEHKASVAIKEILKI